MLVEDTGGVPRPAPHAGWLALAVALTLGACTTGGDQGPTATPVTPATGSSTPAASATPSPSAQAETLVRSGDVTLVVTAPDSTADEVLVDVTRNVTGTAKITLDLGPAEHGPSSVTISTSGRLVRHADGSLTVLDDAGTAAGGLTAPTDGATFDPVDERTVRVVAPDAAGGVSDATPPGATTTTLGTSAVASTSWGKREGGRSLAVEPTDWARRAGEAGWTLAWAELVAADPSVDTATVHDQLVCHGVGAPDKPTWNLEPWRPDVGLFAVLATGCNPTS